MQRITFSFDQGVPDMTTLKIQAMQRGQGAFPSMDSQERLPFSSDDAMCLASPGGRRCGIAPPISRVLKYLPLSLAFATTCVYVGNANAADIGDCDTPEAMTARLKTEGQHSVASAQMIAPDKRLFGMIFTMSDDRKVGYILKADQPLGDRAGQICIYERLADIRLYDARSAGIPNAALLKAPDEDAVANCKRLQLAGKFPQGNCSSLNQVLHRVEPLGERVMIQGDTVAKGPSGIYQPTSGVVTVSGNVNGSINDDPAHPSRGIVGGIAYSSLPDGATILNATLAYPRYTEYGLAALK
jgi:hypothetical protein